MNEKMSLLWATKTQDDEWWSSFVTAPLAILVNYIVVDFRWLTPNLITFVSFTTAIVSAVFIVIGGTTGFVVAAILIQSSHVFDCMDGQMARYRNSTSASGSYFDRATDQLQIALWFGAVGYAAYHQSAEVLPVFLALIGVALYSVRGYVKYVAMHVEMSRDSNYLERMAAEVVVPEQVEEVGFKFNFRSVAVWFIREQRKIIYFDEGVLIFMLSLALVLDTLIPMLWVFAVGQLVHGIFRTWQHGRNIELNSQVHIKK
jgi:phosphatidylglycerophosphate synthase